MKKTADFDEFLRQLEEALDNIMEEMDVPDSKHININVLINVCPNMCAHVSQDTIPKNFGKTPVDIIETEKNIHAMISIPHMEMETITLADSGRVVEITAKNGDHGINERIELPARVNKRFKKTYNNGILELVFNKAGKARKK